MVFKNVRLTSIFFFCNYGFALSNELFMVMVNWWRDRNSSWTQAGEDKLVIRPKLVKSWLNHDISVSVGFPTEHPLNTISSVTIATSGVHCTYHHRYYRSLILTWHWEAAGRVVVVTVGQSILKPADLNGVRRSDRLAGQRERSASCYILILRLTDKGRQTCGFTTVEENAEFPSVWCWNQTWTWPSTSMTIGWDSTSLLSMVSLQRYSPASVCWTWLMLQNTATLVSLQPAACFLTCGLHTWALTAELRPRLRPSGGPWSLPVCSLPGLGRLSPRRW